MMGNIPEVFNLNGVICNQRLVLPVQWLYNSFGQSDCVLKYTDCIVAYVIVVIPLVRWIHKCKLKYTILQTNSVLGSTQFH